MPERSSRGCISFKNAAAKNMRKRGKILRNKRWLHFTSTYSISSLNRTIRYLELLIITDLIKTKEKNRLKEYLIKISRRQIRAMK